MKVLLLGTSNSVLTDGFYLGLKESISIDVVNLSLGASPSIQFSSLIRYNFEDYDYVLFGGLPNDEDLCLYLGEKKYSIVNFNRILYELFSTINKKSNLVILNIPKRQVRDLSQTEIQRKSPIQKHRELLANRVGAQVINLDDILRQFSASVGATIYHCYADDLHPFAFISRYIGNIIADILKNNHKNKGFFFLNSKNNDYSSYYININASKLFDSILVNRRNSLVTARFDKPISNTANLELVSDLLFVGFYWNAVRSACYFNFVCSDNDEYSIKLVRNLDKDLIKIFVPSPKLKTIKKIFIDNKSIGEIYKTQLTLMSDSFADLRMPEIGEFVFRKNLPFDYDAIEDYNVDFDEKILQSIVVSNMYRMPLEFNSNKKTLVNFENSSLYLEVSSKKIVAIHPCLVGISRREFLPLGIEFIDGEKAKIYIEKNNIKYYLNAWENGLFLPGYEGGAKGYLGDVFLFSTYGIQLSFSVAGKYMRSLRGKFQNSLEFNSIKIGSHELFDYQ